MQKYPARLLRRLSLKAEVMPSLARRFGFELWGRVVCCLAVSGRKKDACGGESGWTLKLEIA
jgi:hypothetical protein